MSDEKGEIKKVFWAVVLEINISNDDRSCKTFFKMFNKVLFRFWVFKITKRFFFLPVNNSVYAIHGIICQTDFIESIGLRIRT